MNRYYIVINKITNTILYNMDCECKGIEDFKPFFVSMHDAHNTIEEYISFSHCDYKDFVMFSVEAPKVHEATVSYNVDGEVLY